MNRKQKILFYLMRVGSAPLHELRDPSIGGAAADVRLRELRREHGIPINWHFKRNEKGSLTHTTIYHLDIGSNLIDLDNLKVIDYKPGQVEIPL